MRDVGHRLVSVESGTLRPHPGRVVVALFVTCLLLAFPTPGAAQSVTAILSKIEELEQQMASLERARQSDVSRLSEEVAELRSNSDGAGSEEGADEIVERLARFEAELERMRVAMEGTRAEELGDSLSRVLGSLVDRIEVFLAGSGAPAPPEEGTQSVKPQPAPIPPVTFGGQVRPRYESRSFGSVGDANDRFTSMRVRGTIAAELDRNVRVLIELQDVRLWGEESNTLGDFRADNFDLHQGYISVSEIGGQPVSARVGRQAVAFGGQRLIGAVEWAQQGRVFDGARLTFGANGPKVEVIGMRLAESSAKAIETDASLVGGYATLPGVGHGTLDLYGLYNQASADAATSQVTFGARWHGSQARLTYRVEGSHQSGERAGRDVSAYMFGARVGTTLAQGQVTVGLWYDYLSGDDPSDEVVQSFSTLFATNHKFYGFADLFLNVPVHTGGHGLQDFAVKFSAKAGERTKVGVDLHSFRAAEVGDLASGHFADEADLTVSYQFSRQLSVVGGFSHVFGRDALAEIGRLQTNQTFTYVMTSVRF